MAFAFKRDADGRVVRVSSPRGLDGQEHGNGNDNGSGNGPAKVNVFWKRSAQQMEDNYVERDVHTMTKRMRLACIDESDHVACVPVRSGNTAPHHPSLLARRRPPPLATSQSQAEGTTVDDDAVVGPPRLASSPDAEPWAGLGRASFEVVQDIASSLAHKTPLPRNVALNIVQKSREQTMAIVPYTEPPLRALLGAPSKGESQWTGPDPHPSIGLYFGTPTTGSATPMDTIFEERGAEDTGGMDIDDW